MIVSAHQGNVYAVLKHGARQIRDTGLPFKAPPMPPAARLVNPPKGMLEVRMTNHSLASLLYWIYQSNGLDYKFSRDGASTDFASYFSVECDSKSICAGSLFPSLKTRFPGRFLEITVETIKHPSVRGLT